MTGGVALSPRIRRIEWGVIEAEGLNEAARIYNELARRGERVGGLFHSTC